MKQLISIIVFIAAISAMTLSAQTITVNPKFGKVSKEEVEMTEYPSDTSAVAVMLYESNNLYVNFNAEGGFNLNNKRYMRIKILKEDGLEWGDVSLLLYNTPQHVENVSGIDVVTYNIVDGKIVETKMPKKYVFTEDFSEKYKKLSFSAQDVKVGSVVEIKYDMTSSIYWEIDDIYFQHSIPVNLAEATVRIPDMFTFNKKMMGYHTVSHESEVESGALASAGGSFTYNVNVDKYRAVDMPAFKVEPYLFNAKQYHAFVQYDIRSIFLSGVIHEDFGVTWADVDESYIQSDLMTRFDTRCLFKEEVAAISKDLADIEKIAAAVTLVRDKVEWNKKYNLFPDPLVQVVKAKSGSSSEINSLVAGCLREMGFIVDPVLIKDRTSGILLDYQPEMAPYDTFIISAVASDGTTYYVDAASPDGYVNVINPIFMINKARILRKNGQSGWVDLTKLSRSGLSVTVNAAITPDMRVEGELKAKASGAESYTLKRKYKSCEKEEDFITDIEEDFSLEIEELASNSIKSYGPSAEYSYKFSKNLDSSSERIYLNPFIERYHDPDAFQSIERKYPVDFPYPYVISYMAMIRIPDGYVVEQLPSNAIVKLDAIGASVKLMFMVNEKVLQVVLNYSQTSMLGVPESYNDIREFWQYLNKQYDSMVILKKAE